MSLLLIPSVRACKQALRKRFAMWFPSKPDYDPLLQPFFAARTTKEAEHAFHLLWKKELRREAENALTQRMQGEEERQAREECVNKTEQNLYAKLEGRREAQTAGVKTPGQKKVMDARAYTRRIAENLFVDYMRACRPAWSLLHRHVIAALETRRDLELWKTKASSPLKMAGKRAWKRRARKITWEAQAFLTGDYAEFRKQQLGSQNPSEIVGAEDAGLPTLIGHVLAWIDAPIPVSELVSHLVRLLERTETRLDSLQTGHEQDAEGTQEPKDTRVNLFKQISDAQSLRRAGAFICETDCRGALTRCERGAILLILEREDILDKLGIFHTRLAQSLGFPPSQPDLFQYYLKEIWWNLSLGDPDIKKVLNAEQTISNCRMTAQRKLLRWREERQHEEQSG